MASKLMSMVIIYRHGDTGSQKGRSWNSGNETRSHPCDERAKWRSTET